MANTLCVIMIDNETYTEFMNEISALHPRKRKNWKSNLTDSQGTRSKLIYQGDQMMNYSLKEGKFIRVMAWPKVDIDVELPSMGMTECASMMGVSACAARIMMGMSCEQSVQIDEAKSHTGNHAGRVNHHIAVPAPSTW